jgi:hypothetical protein
MTNAKTAPRCSVPGCTNVAASRGQFKNLPAYRDVCTKHRKVKPAPEPYQLGDPVQFYNRLTGEPYHKNLPTDPVAQAKAMADYQARLTTGHWPREADYPEPADPEPQPVDPVEK